MSVNVAAHVFHLQGWEQLKLICTLIL